MNSVTLFHTLVKHDIKLFLSDGKLNFDAPDGKITGELLEAIKKHRSLIIKILSPCGHCGRVLHIRIAPTWFEARCPDVSCHFLIEEHQHSLGHTQMSEYLSSIKPEISLNPDEWMKMQDEVFERAEILESEEGFSADEAIVRAKEIVVEKFLAAAGAVNGAAKKEKKKKVKPELVLFSLE